MHGKVRLRDFILLIKVIANCFTRSGLVKAEANTGTVTFYYDCTSADFAINGGVAGNVFGEGKVVVFMLTGKRYDTLNVSTILLDGVIAVGKTEELCSADRDIVVSNLPVRGY